MVPQTSFYVLIILTLLLVITCLANSCWIKSSLFVVIIIVSFRSSCLYSPYPKYNFNTLSQILSNIQFQLKLNQYLFPISLLSSPQDYYKNSWVLTVAFGFFDPHNTTYTILTYPFKKNSKSEGHSQEENKRENMENTKLATQDISKLDLTKLTALTPEVMSRQATINIGTIGHVAHGSPRWSRDFGVKRLIQERDGT